MTPYDGSYDPARLRRAATRAVQALGPKQFRVQGTEQPYYDVNLELDTPCDCADAYHHGRGCLHELSARLASGDMPLIQALGDMLLQAQRRLEEATKRTRRRPSRRPAPEDA